MLKKILLTSLMLLIIRSELENNILFTNGATKDNFNELTLKLFYGKEKKENSEQEFLFDFGVNYTMVGNNLGDKNWGYDCTAENSECVVKPNEKEEIDFYFQNYQTYKNYKFFLRIQDEDKLEKPEANLEMRFINEDSENWRLKNVGILGLGYESTFIQYLMKINKMEKINLGFVFSNDRTNYRIKNGISKKIDYEKEKIKSYNYNLYINSDDKGDLNERENNKKFEVDYSNNSSDEFEPRGSLYFEDGTIKLIDSKENEIKPVSLENEKICIINNSPHIIITMSFQVWTYKILDTICKDKVFENCDISLAPKLKVIIKGEEFIFEGKDYLYVTENKQKKKKWRTRFDDISVYLPTYCPKGTEMAVGRGFFENRGLEITYFNNSKKLEFNIFESKTLPIPKWNDDSSNTLVVILIIVLIILIIAIGLFFIIKKRKTSQQENEDNEFYVKED